MLGPRSELERITAPDHDVALAAGLKGPDSIGGAEELCRRQRHRPQRIVPGHAVRDGIARFLFEVANVERLLVAAAGVAD